MAIRLPVTSPSSDELCDAEGYCFAIFEFADEGVAAEISSALNERAELRARRDELIAMTTQLLAENTDLRSDLAICKVVERPPLRSLPMAEPIDELTAVAFEIRAFAENEDLDSPFDGIGDHELAVMLLPIMRFVMSATPKRRHVWHCADCGYDQVSKNGGIVYEQCPNCLKGIASGQWQVCCQTPWVSEATVAKLQEGRTHAE